MKQIILSADSAPTVYLVPDAVAERLIDFVIEFDNWLKDAPEATEYRRYKNGNFIGVCYTEVDFIKWLNNIKYQHEMSILIEELDWHKIPLKYKNCPRFNF